LLVPGIDTALTVCAKASKYKSPDNLTMVEVVKRTADKGVRMRGLISGETVEGLPDSGEGI
jgi:hypothetical protein